jgi:hypothetical protein
MNGRKPETATLVPGFGIPADGPVREGVIERAFIDKHLGTVSYRM